MRMTCSPDSEQYDQADLRELAVDGLKIAAPALAEMRSADRSLQQEGPYALNTKLEVVIKRVPSARLEDPYALEEHGWRESLDTLRSLKDCKAKDQILEWMGKYAGLLSQRYNIDYRQYILYMSFPGSIAFTVFTTYCLAQGKVRLGRG